MCNSDITVAILEKAIEEESNAKKNAGFLGGVFGNKGKPPARPGSIASPPTGPPIV